jgi:hypothetical protein
MTKLVGLRVGAQAIANALRFRVEGGPKLAQALARRGNEIEVVLLT